MHNVGEAKDFDNSRSTYRRKVTESSLMLKHDRADLLMDSRCMKLLTDDFPLVGDGIVETL